jgi:hypothetical protein
MDTVTAAGDATTSRKDTEGPSTSSYRGHPVMVGVDSAGNAIAALVPSTPSIGGVGTTNYWQNNNTYWPIEGITAVAGEEHPQRSDERPVEAGCASAHRGEAEHPLGQQLELHLPDDRRCGGMAARVSDQLRCSELDDGSSDSRRARAV